MLGRKESKMADVRCNSLMSGFSILDLKSELSPDTSVQIYSFSRSFFLSEANVGTCSPQRTPLSFTQPGYPTRSPASSARSMFSGPTWGGSLRSGEPGLTLSPCSRDRSGWVTERVTIQVLFSSLVLKITVQKGLSLLWRGFFPAPTKSECDL